jgi:hypothetical protein
VVQILNLGNSVQHGHRDVSESLLLVENMSINADMDKEKLKYDLLHGEDGDENTNTIREMVLDKFETAFQTVPFFMAHTEGEHRSAVEDICSVLLVNSRPFTIGEVPVEGGVIVNLVKELVGQIRNGGNRYNMVSATEAIVSNMACEAANCVFEDFTAQVRKMGNHPSQINGGLLYIYSSSSNSQAGSISRQSCGKSKGQRIRA